ncbi:MAG: GGDEF domain-containing protein [Firmicutes bacterium]|nr:GGDEF domain-containing protein [Bacillota bacterium]
MMNDYFIHYAGSNFVCMIIFGILMFHDLMNVDRQEKQIKYDHALLAFALYFLSDIYWAAVVFGVLPMTRWTMVSALFANYLLMAAITYMWLRYVMAVELVPHRERAINKFAVLFPFLVSTAALVALYLIAPSRLINDALETQFAFNLFLIIVPIIYIVAVIFYSMKRARSEENPMERKKHLYIGLFPLIVVGGGLIQVLFWPNTPVFCFCCTILMLIIYIQSMETQISTDPLTKLSNRAQLLHYVTQKSNLFIEGRRTFVAMIDANDFKEINDTYGHAEGDKALVFLADALKNVVSAHRMPSFLGRYGGDEFILIAHPVSEKEMEPLIAEMRAELDRTCRENELPYRLSIGVGCDELLGDPDTIQKCIQRADSKLYLDKEYSKLHAHTAGGNE